MTECDSIGIGGGCGFDCDVFLCGECKIAGEMVEDACKENRELYFDIYGGDDGSE